eukprot:1448304-Rhodomonas_salina.2
MKVTSSYPARGPRTHTRHDSTAERKLEHVSHVPSEFQRCFWWSVPRTGVRNASLSRALCVVGGEIRVI